MGLYVHHSTIKDRFFPHPPYLGISPRLPWCSAAGLSQSGGHSCVSLLGESGTCRICFTLLLQVNCYKVAFDVYCCLFCSLAVPGSRTTPPLRPQRAAEVSMGLATLLSLGALCHLYILCCLVVAVPHGLGSLPGL